MKFNKFCHSTLLVGTCLVLASCAVPPKPIEIETTVKEYHPGHYQLAGYVEAHYDPPHYDVYGNYEPGHDVDALWRNGRWHRPYITDDEIRIIPSPHAQATYAAITSGTAIGVYTGAVIGGAIGAAAGGTGGLVVGVGAGAVTGGVIGMWLSE
jgi:hypothetical protein